MGDKSGIDWTDATWNPVTGCTKVSPACANCYIDKTPPFRMAGRKFVNGNIPLIFYEDRLTQPLRWTKPRKIFVNSLSDLFHEDVPDEFIDKVFAVMALAQQHTFQILTKRPERMLAYMRSLDRAIRLPTEPFTRWRVHAEEFLLGRGDYRTEVTSNWPLPNVWLGVSVENQHWADVRIPLLLQTPAAVRFISAEPLLGELALDNYLQSPESFAAHADRAADALMVTTEEAEAAKRSYTRLDWVIGGFESGPRRREGDVDDALTLRDQCAANGVAFLWKQNGGLTSKAGGRLLDGRTHDEFPEVRA